MEKLREVRRIDRYCRFAAIKENHTMMGSFPFSANTYFLSVVLLLLELDYSIPILDSHLHSWY